MSEMDNTPTPEPSADENPSPPPDDSTEAGHEDTTDDVGALRREAAERRRQLRSVEAERDKLREQLDVRDRADVERLASTSLADAQDLWVAGVTLEQLRDDDGTLSAEKVEEAVDAVLTERPHWRRAPTVSFDGGARRTPEAGPPSFGEALKGLAR